MRTIEDLDADGEQKIVKQRQLYKKHDSCYFI